MRRIFIAAFLCLVLLCQMSCKKSDEKGSIIKRSGEPDVFSVSSQDAEMEKAMITARSTIRLFLDALKAPKPNQSGFSIKKPYKDGKLVEHIWLTNVTFDGTVLHGVVNNEPVDVKNVKLRDKATVSPIEISDWMYVEDGKLKGGYTIRVFYNHQSPEEKKLFLQQTGLIIE
jgi:uncharacterized protein YegJ (DUF2314 family)